MIVRIVEHILIVLVLILILIIGIATVIQNSQEEQVAFACGVVSPPLSHSDSLLLAHPGRIVFEQNCTVCHAVRLTVVGPALADVTKRRDSVWVIKMIKDGMGLINSGDSIANKLYKDYNKTFHPKYSDLEDNEIRKMIEYIELASEVEEDVPYDAIPVVVDGAKN